MSLQVIKLLKNLNGSVLFFFLILFTAPLGADDVISGNLGDERRRTNAGPVAIKLVSYNDLSAVQLNTSNETAHQDLISHPDSAIELSSQDNNYSDVASADLKLQQAFWCHQCSNELLLTKLDQRGSDASSKSESEIQTRGTQWIGTVISETGPPSYPDTTTSYLTGHDNNGRLPQAPQVTESRIPGIITKKTTFNIDQKTASVRTPTGPPSDYINIAPTPNRPTDSAFGSPVATLNPLINTQISSRSMQVILPEFRMRMTI